MKAEETVLRVTGMDCSDEVAILERTLKHIGGVRDVRANLVSSKINVTHERSVTPQRLIDAIARTGMEAVLPRTEREEQGVSSQRARLITVALSAVLTGIGLAAQLLTD